MEDKFEELKQDVQKVIDLLAAKEYHQANLQLADASEVLDEILDFCDDDQDLMQVSRYQVLLNQLQQKINSASRNN